MKAWLVLAAAACGGRRPADPLENAGRAPEEYARLGSFYVEWAAPRPELDVAALLPDFTEEVRWPLAISSHPVLEPRFDVAAALAAPGVTWLDLCARGAQHRHVPGAVDQVAYLRAWCSVAGHDAEAAVVELARLEHSSVLGLPAAIELDIANILADHGDATQAERLMDKARLDDVGLLDLLAATYLEVGRSDDAIAINDRALEHDVHPREPDRCHRVVRRIVLAEPGARQRLVDDFELYAKRTSDATCIALIDAAECWVAPGIRCEAYERDHGRPDEVVTLLDTYYRWPDGLAPYDKWWSVVIGVLRNSTEGADRFAVAALENALRTSACTHDRISQVVNLAKELRGRPRHDPELDPRLDVLAAMDFPSCDRVAYHP